MWKEAGVTYFDVGTLSLHLAAAKMVNLSLYLIN
jgi:hypothetical protein